MSIIDEIECGSFIKIGKMHYLVNKFECIKENEWSVILKIDAYFAICINKNSDQKLHPNYITSKTIDIYRIESHVHNLTQEEKEKLIKKIKEKHPSFDFETLSIKQNELSENECIEQLKSKGYLLYKPV